MTLRLRPKRATRIAFVIAALTIALASVSLIARAARRHSDFSVFYRTAEALREGASAEFYGQCDILGGRRCIPPSGTMFFFYMPWVSITGAAAIWLVFNLGLLALSAWSLWRIFGRLDRQRRLYRRTWLWSLIVLMIMSADSIQVGQFSVLFTTCWLVYLALDSGLGAAGMLMLPAAIKIYPALLFAVPLALRKVRQTLWLVPAALLITVLLPLALYGARLPQMWSGFFRYNVFDRTDSRVGDMFQPWEEANQSLDNQLFRYLTDQPRLNQAYPHFPHLHFDPDALLKLIVVLKLAILLVTSVAAWRLGSRVRLQPRWTALLMLGLWSVTLYLLLPENKAPYVVYCFPAWLPLLAMTSARRGSPRRRLGYGMLVVLGLVSQIQSMPFAMRLFGPSLVATVTLWGVLLGMSWRAYLPALVDRPASHHEHRKGAATG